MDKVMMNNGNSLPAWYNVVAPQNDIRNGVLDESIFAANIEEVATGTAPVVYQDIRYFFECTYVTDGIKELIRRVVQALNGKESQNRVISAQFNSSVDAYPVTTIRK